MWLLKNVNEVPQVHVYLFIPPSSLPLSLSLSILDMASSESSLTNDGCVGDLTGNRIYLSLSTAQPFSILLENMLKLDSMLMKLRKEDFTNETDIDLIEGLFADPGFLNLCKLNDLVAKSQSFDQHEGDAGRVISEVRDMITS